MRPCALYRTLSLLLMILFFGLSTPSSAQVTDTDGDGLPDAWEIQYGLDPNDPTGVNGANGDLDGDGFTNYEEYLDDSNPADLNSTPTLDVWTPIGPPDTGTVSTVAPDSMIYGALYAATSEDTIGGYVYKTVDGGKSWTSAQPGGSTAISSIVLDPQNAGVLYAGHNCGGVFKSTDGGGSWVEVMTAECVTSLAIDPLTSTTVYAAGYIWTGVDGIFAPRISKSIDGGQTWTDASGGLPPEGLEGLGSTNNVVVHPEDPNILLTGTGQGLYWSINGGGSWALFDLASFIVTDVVFDPQDPNDFYVGTSGVGFGPTGHGVYQCTIGGNSCIPKNVGMETNKINSLVIDSQNPSILYAGSFNTIFRSLNGGDSWSVYFNGMPTGADAFSLAIDPHSSRTLYAGIRGGDIINPGDRFIYRVITSPTIDDTTPPTASASPVGGDYASPQSITLTASEPATIYYTTDNSTPTTSSTVYTGPITISNATTLKFMAVDSVGNQSTIYTQTYQFNTGLRSPTANGAGPGGDGNGYQTNPTNAYGDDALYAVDTDSGNNNSTSCANNGKDSHRFGNYGFTIPGGSAIRGIEVRLDALADSTSGAPKICVQLSWNGGSSWTAAKSTTTLGTTMQTFTLGSSADTWGRTWSVTNFSNTNFRVRVIDVSSDTARDFSLDWVAVRVHY